MELLVSERGQDDELAALASQARAGSADAFNALARRVRGRVLRWAQGVTHDQDDADDVAQLVLLKLHARIDQFEGRSRFTTWLYRLTRNVAFSRAARDRRHAELLAQRTTESLDDMAVTERETASLTELVQFYLAELPKRQQTVFELGDIRGLNSTEIAERLGITASTARGLLMKARRRIRLQILKSHAHLVEDYTP
jgi:RNA polymerase sigma-70 factor (ECF subfamily)